MSACERDTDRTLRAYTLRWTFRPVQVVRSSRHIAPAGLACLNNNAPSRRGRPTSVNRAPNARSSGRPSLAEAICSPCIL